MGHMATYLVEISSKADFKNIAQQPDIILTVRTEIHKRKKIYYIFFFQQKQLTSQHLVGQLLVGETSWGC